MENWRSSNPGELIWFHAASLGEFEQGRPIIEKIRQEHPQKVVLLTFFSPSGFEIRKDYSQVNGVFYLPIDTSKNAREFIRICRPKLAIFIKYEIWPNYFLELKSQQIRLIMVSVNFRQNQRFFKGMTRFWWNDILKNCQAFFTQNERTTRLLIQAGHQHVITAGDTRYDRVCEVASKTLPPAELIAWKGSDKLLIAGSTWPSDDNYLLEVLKKVRGWKVVFFPHNLNDKQVQWIIHNYNAQRWSSRGQISLDHYPAIVVDEIGWLSAAYGAADMAWIGGGFEKGIHNTLEAAAWGVPICFGPRFEKFDEAIELIAINAAKSARSIDDLDGMIHAMNDEHWRLSAGVAGCNYVHSNTGATDKILNAFGID